MGFEVGLNGLKKVFGRAVTLVQHPETIKMGLFVGISAVLALAVTALIFM